MPDSDEVAGRDVVRQEAREVVFDTLGLDEFERIAASELLDEIEVVGIPAPGSVEERKLVELGNLVRPRVIETFGEEGDAPWPRG